jgi:hypothetical protein
MNKYKRIGYSPLKLMFRAPTNGLVEFIGKIEIVNFDKNKLYLYDKYPEYPYLVDIEELKLCMNVIKDACISKELVIIQGELITASSFGLNSRQYSK